jgi:hypothetical protein
MKLSISQFCLEEPDQLGLDTNLILSSVNVNSLRKFCEFDNFVNENIRMSHRIYSKEDDWSELSHANEHKNSIRTGSKYQAVIPDSSGI